MRVDQWVPALHRGDAIGDSARLMRDAFRSWGHTADVYALELDADLVGDGRPFAEWTAPSATDVVTLHYALPSPLTPALKAHRGRRVLLHHNITPPAFFAEDDPDMARICALGEQELQTLARHVDLGLADSEFNRRELEALGFRRTGALPIYLDFRRYRQAPTPVLRGLLEDGATNLPFVGRPPRRAGWGCSTPRSAPRRWESWRPSGQPIRCGGPRSRRGGIAASPLWPPPRWSRRSAAISSRCERTAAGCHRGPALRGGHHRGVRVAGPRGGRAPGRVLRRDRLHDLRPRLRDLAQRAAGRGGDAGGSARAAVPGRGRARPRRLQRVRGAAVSPGHNPRGRAAPPAPPGARRAPARGGAPRGAR